MKKPPALNQIDLMFRAFSDPTRLRILHVLHQRETCVGDLVQILQVPQAKVSRHLAYLRKSGLAESRKAGLWSYYSLAPANNPFHKNLLDCLKSCFREVPEIKADALRAAKIKKAGGCCPD